MALEIVCSSCGTLVYAGYDLRYIREVLKPTGGKCKGCGSKLSQSNFSVEIKKAAS
jgi:hypothetical protein